MPRGKKSSGGGSGASKKAQQQAAAAASGAVAVQETAGLITQLKILDVVDKLQSQVDNLSKLAEQYLDQGLLGQHSEALSMRDKALKTLQQYRPAATAAPAAAPAASSTDVAQAERAAPAASTAPVADAMPATPAPTFACATPDGGAEAAAEPPTASGGRPPWQGPAAVEKERLLPAADAADGLLAPRYRWCQGDAGAMVLEVLEPAGAGDELLVDISAAAVRLSWGAWSLALPLPHLADAEACKVERRRRRRLLALTLPPPAPPSPSPSPAGLPAAAGHVDALAEALASAEGYAVSDAFLTAGEADGVRARLLELWRTGGLQPGQVEGSQDVNNASRARSDEFAYAEDGEAAIMAFARRLDRAVVELVRRVPSLRGRKLMRGKPMAAVYAGAGSRYTPHFDCVGGDNGRVITCIVYLNPFWRPDDGALLKLWPEAKTLLPAGPCREVEPLHGRLVAFLCDSRNLHAVTPVAAAGAKGRTPEPRLALSCWYYDEAAIPSLAESQATQDAPLK